MRRNLDLLDMLRRLKMHGFALTSQLDTLSMKFISQRTGSQPLSEVRNFYPRSLWQKYEVMTQQDRFGVSLLKKIKKKSKDMENWKKFRPKTQNIGLLPQL